MPYTMEKDRKEMQWEIKTDRICDYFSTMKISEFAGNLNYFITRIVNRYVKVNGKKYFTFAVIVGTLICCVLELYRRKIGKYEDEKIQSNGDVK